jgi:polysaccharide biosynthesis PFTS motif protein
MLRKRWNWQRKSLGMNNSQSIKMLSYNYFVESGGLKRLRMTKQSVINSEIEKIKKSNFDSFERENYLCYVQKIVAYTFNSSLTSKMAHSEKSNSKVSMAMPQHWLNEFRKQSFLISKIRSRFKWAGFVFLLISKSLWETLKTNFLRENFELNRLIKSQKKNNKQAVLINPKFPKGKILQGEPFFDFAVWYSRHFMKDKELAFINFNQKPKETHIMIQKKEIVCSEVKTFKFGISFSMKIQLLVYAMNLFVIGCFNLLRSNPSTLVNFSDLIFAKRLTFITKEELPDTLVFSDSHGVLMPYWINTLNKIGHEVQYIFFSSYDSPTLYSDEDPRLDFWKLNSWPKIYCVDNYQKEFISKNLFTNSQKVTEIGFPYFSDSLFKLPKTTKPTIALFDFEPGLNHFGVSTLSESGFNSYETNKLFISGIYQVAKDLGFMIFHKPKRQNVMYFRDRFYRDFIDTLSSDYYLSIPPETSPARLIVNTDCTICMPISSPGFIALNMGKKSLYLDPVGSINPNDPALRGAPLAKNQEDIRAFLIKILDGEN